MPSIRTYMTVYYMCHELIQRQIQSNTNTKINFRLFKLSKWYAVAQAHINFKFQHSCYSIQILFKYGLSNGAERTAPPPPPIILSRYSACRKFIPIVCRKISCLSLFVTLRVNLMQWIYIIRIQHFILNSYVSDDRQGTASREWRRRTTSCCLKIVTDMRIQNEVLNTNDIYPLHQTDSKINEK